MIRIAGEDAFGPIPPETESALALIDDAERLERIVTAIRKVDGWDDLLATP